MRAWVVVLGESRPGADLSVIDRQEGTNNPEYHTPRACSTVEGGLEGAKHIPLYQSASQHQAGLWQGQQEPTEEHAGWHSGQGSELQEAPVGNQHTF